MKYAIIKNNEVLRYPASLSDLKELNPDTSFPDTLDSENLSNFGLTPVLSVEPPAYDSTTQVVEQGPIEFLEQGEVQETWIVRDLSLDELKSRCDYQAFWDALLISNLYQKIRTQAASDLNINLCCTEFIAAITDAKFGRPNHDAIQMCVWLLIASLSLNEADFTELNELMSVGKMSAVFTLVPPVQS